jgi:hypothetical protein
VITDQEVVNYARAGLGGFAVATYLLANTLDPYPPGSAFKTDALGFIELIEGEWWTGVSGSPSDYECRGTIISTEGTWSNIVVPLDWVPLSENQRFSLRVANNYGSILVLVEIRLASTGVVVDSANISLTVDSAP